MSAIFGCWSRGDGHAVVDAMEKMGAALRVFGPDRGAQWCERNIGLGGQFKRTLPEDDADTQPLIGGEGRYVLVADARIDDRPALVERLGLKPGPAARLADPALLLAAWERWGSATPGHLYGEFAFAVFDRRDQRLFLARDHAGLRPLFFHRGRDLFAFASMPSGISALPAANRGSDLQALMESLLLQETHGERTCHAGISRVLPGGCGWFDFHTGWRPRTWWSVTSLPAIRMKTPEAYAATLRERTERAVRATLRRRGGIASQMSSGFDSSAVTVTAARLLAEEGQALTAYTHVPRPGWNPADDWPGTRGDEGPLAALAAARYPNIRHVCLPFAQGDLVGSSRQLLGLAGRPIRNLLNTVWLRQIGEAAAAGGATTMLVGSAGNATISFDGALLGPWLLWRGHGWRWLAQALRVPAGPGRNAYVRESVRAGVPSEWVAAVRRLLGRVQPVNEVPHPVRAGLLGDAAQQAALGLQLRDRPGAWPRVNQLALRRRLLTDADPGAVRKAWLALTGVEWRDPLAARDLCEWCFAIPAERYAQAGQRRSLYKQAFAHDLPAELIGQTRRGEQAADWIPTVEAARSAILEQIDLARGDGCWNAVLDLERMAQPLNSPRPLHPRTDLVEVKFVTLRGLSALLFGQVAGAADITRRQLCEA